MTHSAAKNIKQFQELSSSVTFCIGVWSVQVAYMYMSVL